MVLINSTSSNTRYVMVYSYHCNIPPPPPITNIVIYSNSTVAIHEKENENLCHIVHTRPPNKHFTFLAKN